MNNLPKDLWYNPLLLRGNYWDDYDGVDEVRPFGIGDTPYKIPPMEIGKDRFPLMEPDTEVSIVPQSQPSSQVTPSSQEQTITTKTTIETISDGSRSL